MHEKAPFKTWDHGNKPFVSEKVTFGKDKTLPKVIIKENILHFISC